MTKGKISDYILNGIRKEAKDDTIEKFLIELIYEEASHPGHWNYKKRYKELIEKYSIKWSKADDH